jgi:uncharacterized circularly permuted ATP-grasp superfamily protein/uncharacterized alpha-E superfamily protein
MSTASSLNPTSQPTDFVAPTRLSEGYQPPPSVYDEMASGLGSVRPHWQKFLAGLDALGPAELGRRWEAAKRLIHENGVTYNLYADPLARERPWELDPVPLVVAQSEWQALAASLTQRARLLNLILADLYGPQRLLHEGLVPAELLFAHDAFLRPCHNLHVPRHTYLHLYAAHLARSTDGQWQVLGDRTQVPSGAGYSLENRIVISRMLPHVFHDCQVQRLATFFMTLRDTLRSLALHHRENPRIVLLSPGPHSPTYFEDAYLARYLGYTLVAGDDLAVRDYHVYLKTLGGLLPVDVILRRVYDADCDPLELRSDSLLGVPGLVQAARNGTVAIANSLGSGLVEAPVWSAFLPALCRYFLAEDLQLPSVQTWWCGRPGDLQYVLEHLSDLVIKPAFTQRVEQSVFGDRMSDEERNQLADRIRAAPRNFVAQERLVRSATPVWGGERLQPCQLALRTFVVAGEDGYSAMPGGLCRVSVGGEWLGDSMGSGEGSKDVWVLSEGPVAPVSLLHPAGQALTLRRSGNELPSRVADNLFWLGRHAERCEGKLRLLRSLLARLSSESETETLPEIGVLFQALAGQGQQGAEAIAPHPLLRQQVLEDELFAWLFDAQRPDSLRSTLSNMHQMAATVRDRISVDSWRILYRIEQDFRRPPLPRDFVQPGDMLALLNQVLMNLSAFSGLAMESMTRTQGWRFLDMGRRLERAVYTCALLRSTLVVPGSNESAVIESVLEIADSLMTYRARYLTTLQGAPLLDLLVTDESNPRSIAFQLAVLTEHVENLPRDQTNPMRTNEQRLTISALTGVRLADVENLAEVEGGVREKLDRLLARLVTHLRNLSETISHTYLIHAGPSRQMSELAPRRS